MPHNCLRRFNDKGLAAFNAALLGDGGKHCRPESLLESFLDSPEFTEVVAEGVELPEGPFANKYEFGKALAEALGPEVVRRALADDAVWPWLSYVYRDCVMPLKPQGRFVGSPSRHCISNMGERSSKSHHRHLVRAAVSTVHRFGEDARYLMGKIDGHTTYEEQMMSRRESLRLASAAEIVKAVGILYFDPKKQRHKRNAAKDAPGSMIRLVEVINQLDVSYEIESLTAAELLALLPRKEFGQWLPAESLAQAAA